MIQIQISLVPLQAGVNWHMTIILGLPAVILLGVGTLLYQISKEKYTFAHGVCAGLALLLTTINIAAVIPMTNTVLSAPPVDLFHMVHIILGIVGYVFGIGAFLTGISGVRTKIPGFVALFCWTAAFVMGYIQFLM